MCRVFSSSGRFRRFPVHLQVGLLVTVLLGCFCEEKHPLDRISRDWLRVPLKPVEAELGQIAFTIRIPTTFLVRATDHRVTFWDAGEEIASLAGPHVLVERVVAMPMSLQQAVEYSPIRARLLRERRRVPSGYQLRYGDGQQRNLWIVVYRGQGMRALRCQAKYGRHNGIWNIQETSRRLEKICASLALR